MKELPKYFVIKNPGNTELWKKYINWLNKKYNQRWAGNVDYYYGFDGNPNYNGTNSYFNASSFYNNPTVLTLEEWNNIVNSKENPSYTIQDLAEGRCMVINDGTYEELQTVLKAAHSNTEPFYGKYSTKYFWTSYNYFWRNNDQGDKNLPAQSVKEFLKQLNMIDYKIKGTKLPIIPAETNFRCTSWKSSDSDDLFNYEFKDFVSFGSVVYNNEVYILAERKDYKGRLHYMIKEEDILKLTNTKNMQKEIIGYRLVKRGYLTAVQSIVGHYGINDEFMSIKGFPTVIAKLKEAKVLDLWFEPVYKSKEKIINIGFDVKATSEGIFHKSDNITEFVEKMYKEYNSLHSCTFGNYKAKFKDIIWESTGCQNVETKLSDWKKVWETYQEMNK